MHAGVLRSLIFLVALMSPSASLLAQSPQADEQGQTYITPFADSDTYRLQIYGDVFAEGIVGGLVEALAADQRVQIQRKHKPIGPIVKPEFDEEIKVEETSREVVHIAVVMLGYSDRNPFRAPGAKRIQLGTDDWRSEYGRRVDRVIKALKRRSAAIYWVGMPILRRPEANDDAVMINEVIRERAFLNGAKFVDIHAGFADADGNYDRYGPDITGKPQLLREADGILFTAAGNRKVAHFVEREIKRDLAAARSARVLPLAGAEAEQQRVNPTKAASGGTVAPAAKGQAVPRAPAGAAQQAAANAAQTDTSGDQKAENVRLSIKQIGASGREETVAIDIVRPAIPASVIALLTRRESADKASTIGDSVIDDIGSGLSVMNTVTGTGEAQTGAGGRRKLPPTHTADYKVLVKGERLPSKPGRADDAAWPRSEAPIAAAAPPTATRPLPTAPARVLAPPAANPPTSAPPAAKSAPPRG
jgi:uncharacterized protein